MRWIGDDNDVVIYREVHLQGNLTEEEWQKR